MKKVNKIRIEKGLDGVLRCYRDKKSSSLFARVYDPLLVKAVCDIFDDVPPLSLDVNRQVVDTPLGAFVIEWALPPRAGDSVPVQFVTYSQRYHRCVWKATDSDITYSFLMAVCHLAQLLDHYPFLRGR